MLYVHIVQSTEVLYLKVTRSVIKKWGPRPGSLGPVLDRARPSAHVILAWVFKSSVGL